MKTTEQIDNLATQLCTDLNTVQIKELIQHLSQYLDSGTLSTSDLIEKILQQVKVVYPFLRERKIALEIAKIINPVLDEKVSISIFEIVSDGSQNLMCIYYGYSIKNVLISILSNLSSFL